MVKNQEKDTKNLYQRGNTWWLDFCFSEKHPVKELANMRLRFSLGVRADELDKAIYLRDQYLKPILAKENIVHILNSLAMLLAQEDENLGKIVQEKFPHLNLKFAEKKVSIKELSDKFMMHLDKLNTLQATTKTKYQTSLFSFCKYIGEATLADEIDDKIIKQYLGDCRKLPLHWQKKLKPAESINQLLSKEWDKTISPRTICNHLIELKKLFQWGKEEGYLPMSFKDISVTEKFFMKVQEKRKKDPSKDEVERMISLQAPSGMEVPFKYIPIIGKFSLMRVGEIGALEAEDVKTENGIRFFDVRHKTWKNVKNDNSERKVPISDKLMPYVDELLKMRPVGRLFPDAGDWEGSRGGYKVAHKFIKVWNKKVKEVAPDLSFHCLRVYGNCRMMDARIDGYDRKNIMGQTNNDAHSAYVSFDLKRLKEAVDTIP